MSVSAHLNTESSKRGTLLSRVRIDLMLRDLSGRELLALGVISILALAVRAWLQHNRVFIGDEVGTLRYLKTSPEYILSHFKSQLTMNYFILAEKGVAWLCGKTDWRLTLLPLAGAAASIPLTAALALKFTGSTRTSLIAAGLAAFNPYLVMFGPKIRSYSLLVAFSLLAVNEFLNWYRRRDWWSGARCAAAVVLLLLTHLNGVYIVATLAVLVAIEAFSLGSPVGRKFLWKSGTLWILLTAAGVVVIAAYWHLIPDIVRVSREWGTDTPPTSMAYLPQLFTAYMGMGYVAFMPGLLLLCGVWSATQAQRPLLLLCLAIILSPVLMSLQGVSVYPNENRYLIFCLPWLLIVLAAGIDWVAKRVRVRRGAALTAWGLAAMIILSWTPAIHSEFVVKKNFPYARVAEFLQGELRENDTVVAGWSVAFTLSQFFDDAPKRILMPDKYLSKVASRLDTRARGRVFYVTAQPRLEDSKAQVHHFRSLKVISYRGETPRALLEQWREDLLYQTRGEVHEHLQSDYRLLALMEELLPSGQSPDHWQFLAESCAPRPPAGRYFHPPLLFP